MENGWKLAAKLKKKVDKTIADLGEKAGELSEKLEDVANTARTNIHNAGGPGAVIEDAVRTAGEAIGKGVGHAAKAAHGAMLVNEGDKPRDIYEKGDVDVEHAAEYGRRTAETVIKGTKTAAQGLAKIAKEAAHRAEELYKEADEHLKNYDVPEEMRYVTIGKLQFRVDNVETRDEVEAAKAYLKETSKKMPSNLKGRGTLLTYIAMHGVTSDDDLRSSWEERQHEELESVLAYVLPDMKK